MKYNLGDKSLLFKYISINLKNVYLSTIQVSDEYTLDLAKHIYGYLNRYYPKLNISNVNGNVEDISEYFLHGHDKQNLSGLDLGAIIKPVANSAQDRKSKIVVYDDNSKTAPESILDINKYNIISWPINDSIIQFLQPGVVISDYSSVDDIANAQYSLINAGYKISKIKDSQIDNIGVIDEDFTRLCWKIQNLEKDKDSDIVTTGYYDIYVESYVRGLSEVRN